MARSRSGTRGRRGPRKPPRRDGAFNGAGVQTLDPRERGAIELPGTITVKELAELLGVNPADIIRELIKSGIFATINQLVDRDTASLVAGELGYEVAETEAAAPGADETDGQVAEATKEVLFEEDDPSLLQPRAPIVTVMGHVDHGKTSLLDAIRTTEVAAGERGGITQHIGASEVTHDGKRVVFLDTPGHEAFTAMRARGARVTDIAVVVVAADDGVMPQTLEAISHAKAAKVPIIIALNKIDKADANADRVKTELTEAGIVVEEYGGDVPLVPVSAKTRLGLDELIEMILLVADLQELKANPKRDAIGTIVEAKLDKGRGPVATALVQTGTLKVGDIIVVGETFGRVRALENDLGKRVTKAGPSSAVVILGLSDVPQAGDILRVVSDEKEARTMVETRKAATAAKSGEGSGRATLEDLYSQIQAGQAKELRIILKSDVSGSLGAITHALEQLDQDEIRLNVLLEGAGDITDNDIMLAAASNAIVVGFNTKITDTARRAAEAEGVDVRLYDIIYKLTDDIEAALKGLLEPEIVEVVEGRAEVRQIIRVGKNTVIAGSFVTDGRIVRGGNARVWRSSQGHRHRPDRVAPALPRRRSRGPRQLRMRHRARRIPRHPGRRHHRVLHVADRVAATAGRDARARARRTRRDLAADSARLAGASAAARSVSQRTERVDELLRQEIGAIVAREVADPRIGFATITSRRDDADLRHAKVWVSVIGQPAERDAAVGGAPPCDAVRPARAGQAAADQAHPGPPRPPRRHRGARDAHPPAARRHRERVDPGPGRPGRRVAADARRRGCHHADDLPEEPPSAVATAGAGAPQRREPDRPAAGVVPQGRTAIGSRDERRSDARTSTPSRRRSSTGFAAARRVLAVSHENPDADTLGRDARRRAPRRGAGRHGRSGLHGPGPAALRLHGRRRALPDRPGPGCAVRPARDLRLRLARADRRGRRPSCRAVRAAAAGDHRPPRLERRGRRGRLDRPGRRGHLRDGRAARRAARASPLDAGDGALAAAPDGRHRHGHRDLRPPERDAADARRLGGAGRGRRAAVRHLAAPLSHQARRPAAAVRRRPGSARERRRRPDRLVERDRGGPRRDGRRARALGRASSTSSRRPRPPRSRSCSRRPAGGDADQRPDQARAASTPRS